MIKVVHTEKFKVSTSNLTVIIPTAGLGTRLGKITKSLNKSLIPYKNKPVLAHIIDSFPNNTHFIIPLGYLADQVINFCNLAYPTHNFTFVKIDDYASEKSGPGYTIKKCLDLINSPFWYIPCDTYFDENILTTFYTENTYFIKKVPATLSSEYTMFKTKNGRISEMTFKKKQDDSWVAFTGVMYIHNFEDFKNRILTDTSSEIIYTISLDSRVELLQSWLDLGNLNIYKSELSKIQNYDFRKTDEITYITNNKVVKWYQNETIAQKKYIKWLANRAVCPTECLYKNNWLVYNYFLGDTIYQKHDIEILNNMLDWLIKKVWIRTDQDIKISCTDFYKTKTQDRILKFLHKYPKLENVKYVNGKLVQNWNYYFDKIDWNLLSNINLPGFIHGDLQFDNVIIDSNNNFKIIDWRHEFGNHIEIGDIYYDLAKLTGGLLIDYSKIKANEFGYNFNNNEVTLTKPRVKNSTLYINTVKNFIQNQGWNYEKVQLLVPIIFWNMAPLHNEPFDKFLWYYGIELFEELKL